MMPILNHTAHTKKQIPKSIVTSHATNIIPIVNYRFIKPQNGPILHEHAVQGPHIASGVVLPILAHLSTHVIKNYLPIGTISPYGQPDTIPWVSIPSKLHLLVNMP
jgi:hypothetical protein